MKRYQPPFSVEVNHGIQPDAYFIEEKKDGFWIHRVLKEKEYKNFEKVIFYEDEHILRNITHCSTLKEAEKTIQSYWDAVYVLNQMFSA